MEKQRYISYTSKSVNFPVGITKTYIQGKDFFLIKDLGLNFHCYFPRVPFFNILSVFLIMGETQPFLSNTSVVCDCL